MNFPFKSINQLLTTILALTIIISLLGSAFVYSYANKEEFSFAQINLSGKLRMLSQGIAKHSYEFVLGDKLVVEEVNHHVEEYELILTALERGGTVHDKNIPRLPQELMSILEENRKEWESYKKQVQILLDGGSHAAMVDGPILYIKSKNQYLTEISNRVTEALEKRMNHDFDLFKILIPLLLCLNIAIFVFAFSLIRKRIVLPIQSISNSALRIAEGQNKSLEIPEYTGKELEILTETLNRTISAIEENARLQFKLTEEEKFGKLNKKYHTLFQKSNDAIFITDLQTMKIIDANQSAVKMTDYSLQEMQNLSLTDLMKDSPQNGGESVSDSIREESSLRLTEARFEGKDQKLRDVDISLFPIKWEKEHLAISIVRDMTEFKKLQIKGEADTLRLAQIGSSTGKIVHDMNNPLHTLLLLTDRMTKLGERCQTENNFHCPVIEKLVASNILLKNKLTRMVNEILDIARGDSMKLNLRNVEFGNYLEDVIHHNREGVIAGRNACKVSSNIEFNEKVDVDTERFGRVMENLLKNAFEALAGNKDGLIEISCRGEGDHVITIISDNGPGIPTEVRENMFFLKKSLGKEKGTGFGLLICREIIELHKGEISYASLKGKTTFTIKIPRESGATA